MNTKHGFTLVELMIVTSIISLLSSIILSSVNGARIKADNAYRIRTMEEYVKGVLLYRENSGAYPWGYALAPGYICMASTNCGMISPGTTFNTIIDSYVKIQPAFRTLTDPNGTLDGPYYFCNIINPDNSCTEAFITWPQKGSDQPCNILGATSQEIATTRSTLTLCKTNFDSL